VRSLSIVVPPPPLVQDLGFAQCSEDLGVQQFIPELAVEAFIETVFLGAPRCDVEGFDPDFRQLFSHGPGDELWPIVRTDVIRRTMMSG